MLFYTQQNQKFITADDFLTTSQENEWIMFKKSYSWLKDQYQKRINPNFPKENALIFGWPESNLNEIETMPAEHCIIIADIPKERILPSDFQAWHMVLNNMTQLDEYQPFDWNTIFSESKLRKNGFLTDSEKFEPQLVVDGIYKSEIINIIRH